jgi:diguanylate cyclase (GGDEF)-like protein/PAS domain S-box-containing protein
MGRPLRVVVVGDGQAVALKVAADLDQCGFAPAVVHVANEGELERCAGDSELVVAWHPTDSLPVDRVLHLLGARPGAPPVVAYGDSFTEDEVADFMRAGARDCLRRGDLRRVRAAFERETTAAVARRSRAEADAGDRYRALIEEIPALTYVAWADESGSRAYVSPQLLTMTGYSPGEWLAEPDMWVRRLHPEDREAVLGQFRDACASGGRFASEYRLLDRDGRVVWWRDEGRILPGPDGAARFVRGFVLDVTEQKLAEESLRRLRFYDQLTGLPNRVLLLRRLGRALADSTQTGRPLALLILALDHFRDTTNTLGHHNADLIIRDLAGRLGDALGDSDHVARLRGDEFGLLLPDADAAFARQLGERVLTALDRPFMVQRLPIEVSASIGIAVAPQHGSEAETLLRRADVAVQVARKVGGTAIELYSPEIEPHDPLQLALVGELRHALEGNQLQLYYQPKVDLKTHSVVGAEALLRWPHPKRGFVPPSEFIPLAENVGLIRPLTRWVLDRAIAEARAWRSSGRKLNVAVNVSARSLHDDRVVEDVDDLLHRHEFDARHLVVEVTETAMMRDPVRADAVLGSLTARGVAVSIDDFGTGSTSFGLLRKHRIAELKIDGSFVGGMKDEGGDGSSDTAIVRSTADLAHNLGLSVVAEGVEDRWTLDLLSSFGCDQAQGYHIARPMPGPAFVEWLRDPRSADAASWRTLES